MAAEELCSPPNVDSAKLEAYARHAVGAFVPSLEAHEMCPGQLSLFDFSERKQSNRACALVTGSQVGSKQDTPCVVTRVGDALQEPFWPEGLGINRGFLGAYDCADLVLRASPLLITDLGQKPATLDDFGPILQRREAIYALTKRISGSNRQKELKPHSGEGSGGNKPSPTRSSPAHMSHGARSSGKGWRGAGRRGSGAGSGLRPPRQARPG